MVVYVNRVRRGYLKKRSTREMALATVCFIGFVALLGFAGRDELREEMAMEEAFTSARRSGIMEWSRSVPVYEVRK